MSSHLLLQFVVCVKVGNKPWDTNATHAGGGKAKLRRGRNQKMKNDQAGGSQTSKKLGATSDMEQWLCKSIFGHVKASYFLFSTYWRILLSLSSVQNLGPETEFETQPYICDGSPALDHLVIHVYMVKVLKTTKQMIWLWFHNNIFILCTTYICQNNQIYLLFLKSSVGLAGALYLTQPRDPSKSIHL